MSVWRIRARLQPIHVVIVISGGLVLRIRDGEEIAVGRIVGEGGGLTQRGGLIWRDTSVVVHTTNCQRISR